MRNAVLGLLLFLSIASIKAQNKTVQYSGDVLLVALPLATASTAYWTEPNSEGLRQYINAAAATAVTTYALKWTIDKERPDGDRFSFPSGHTSFCFTAAGFLQQRYGWKWGAPAYVLSGYVGWSRVVAKRHDYVDVLAGAAIGLLSAAYLTTPFLEEYNVSLTLGPQSAGLKVFF
jgi:membrane-associated phospholipid phosphatase